VPASATATFAGTALPLYALGETELAAIVGISIWSEPGLRTLEATLRDGQGRTAAVSTTVLILPADYPVDYVDLPPDVQELLDPDVSAQEWEHVRPFLEQVTPERLWEGLFISPTLGWITSRYGGMRSYNGAPPSSYHSGLDIGNYEGTPIVAPAAGRVVLAEPLILRGNCIIIDHGWGVHTSYFHLSAIEVQAGDMVKQGQHIGKMGATGMATGSHLHWEVRVGMITVDPEEWLRRSFP
jgi:murein DD-endopeptidase MepM/ murein hydrolase activator NlpD